MADHDETATMTVEQAGRLMGLSLRATYRAVESGHIPVIRLGRRILVLRHKLNALLGIPDDAASPSADKGKEAQ